MGFLAKLVAAVSTHRLALGLLVVFVIIALVAAPFLPATDANMAALLRVDVILSLLILFLMALHVRNGRKGGKSR
jgi:hypothetical protein